MSMENRSVYRNLIKNQEKGWGLISISAEPTLYMNIQFENEVRSIPITHYHHAMRVGELITSWPITTGMERKVFTQEYGEVWNGTRFLTNDRDLFRVELPLHNLAELLERIGSILPSSERFEVYRGMGIERKDYSQRCICRTSKDGKKVVLDSGHGRYAVIDEDGTLTLYEAQRALAKIEGGNASIDALFDGMAWITYENKKAIND